MILHLALLMALTVSAADAPRPAKTLHTFPEGVPDAAMTVLATTAESSVNLWSLETGKQVGHFEIPVFANKTPDDYNSIRIHSVRPDLKLLLVSNEHAYAGERKNLYDRMTTQFFLVSLGEDASVKKIWGIEGPCSVADLISFCPGFGALPSIDDHSFIFDDRPEVRLFVQRPYEGHETDYKYKEYINLTFDLKGRKLFENKVVYNGDEIVKGSNKFYDSGKTFAYITSDAQSCRVMLGKKHVSFLDGCVKDDYPQLSSDGKFASSLNKTAYKAWDIASGALTTRLDPQLPEGWSPRVWTTSLDGRVAAIVVGKPKEYQVQVWSTVTGKKLATVACPDNSTIGGLKTNGHRLLYWRIDSENKVSRELVDIGLDDAPSAPTIAPAISKVDVDNLPASGSKADPDAFAVVIGVEKYRQAGVPAVDYAARDAKTMAAYLGTMGFDPKNVAVLTDAQAGKVDFDKYFGKWLKNRVGPKSRVFVYYAGHGAPNPTTGAGYLMPYEADPSYLEETAYPVTQLYAELAKLPTKDVTVVLDACFSGQGERSLIAKGTRPLVALQKTRGPENAAVIAAASGSQISASDHEARHGLLTYHLLAGLHGAADEDKDGEITTSELFAYARPAVERAAKLQNVEQTPTVSGDTGAAGARVWTTLKKP